MAAVSPPLTSGIDAGNSHWRGLDWLMLALVLFISLWGVATVMSATRPRTETRAAQVVTGAAQPDKAGANEGEGLSGTTLRQGIFVAVGLAALAALAFFNFQWLMHLQSWMYFGTLAILVAVLLSGRTVNGAKSWIDFKVFSLQPSEFAKFGLMICLAAFLCRRQERIREGKTLLLSLLYLAPPLLLILKQPDFGTMLAVLSIWFGMMFFGGAKGWHLALVVLVGATMFGAAWKYNVLKPHQKDRLAVFLDKSTAPRGAGYQVRQSQIAIGGGQISGQGWGRGIQNRGSHVPENQTDFIFSVVAEELGFAGASVLLLCYALLLFRTAHLASTTENYFGALIAGGFTALLAFHTIVNIGMTMRVMPITGVPLPFFSYGGSSYLTFAACVGLLQSISLHSKRHSF